MTQDVRFTRLNNGVRVTSESVRDVASVSLGLWVENGSRFESEPLRGVSHFIEHLMFKGTPSRSARRIAEEIESVGGTINAFTGKETTCYHTRTPAEYLERSLEVVADMLLYSSFRQEDVELEREVVLQEIHDSEDVPEDHIHDFFLETYWPGHPLGWPVAGTVQSVAAMSGEEIVAYRNERYQPDRILVAASGALEHERLVDLCRSHLGGLLGSFDHPFSDRPDVRPGVFVKRRDLEQVHVAIGFPGIAARDPRRYAADLMISALGGGMSSRLFQEIREERGKAYTVYAFQSGFQDIGYTGVYAATGRESVGEVVDLVMASVLGLAKEGLAEEELERVKGQLIGSIPLSLESTENRMLRIARDRLSFDREVPVPEVIAGLEAVTNADVIELARELFTLERAAVALLGDADEHMVSLPAG